MVGPVVDSAEANHNPEVAEQRISRLIRLADAIASNRGYPRRAAILSEIGGQLQLLARAMVVEPITVDCKRLERLREIREDRGNAEINDFHFSDEACLELHSRGREAARSSSPVFIFGPRGTGKSSLAEAIHNESQQNGKQPVIFDAAAHAPQLHEALLFGSDKLEKYGSVVAGLAENTKGAVLLSDGSSLIIENPEKLSPAIQRRLLTTLETKAVKGVGTDELLSAAPRVIFTSSNNPEELVKNGALVPELLDIVPRAAVISMPKLSDTPSRCAELINLVARDTAKEGGELSISGQALGALQRYGWPGNIRELLAVVSAATLRAEEGVVSCVSLRGLVPTGGPVEARTLAAGNIEALLEKVGVAAEAVPHTPKPVAAVSEASAAQAGSVSESIAAAPPPSAGTAGATKPAPPVSEAPIADATRPAEPPAPEAKVRVSPDEKMDALLLRAHATLSAIERGEAPSEPISRTVLGGYLAIIAAYQSAGDPPAIAEALKIRGTAIYARYKAFEKETGEHDVLQRTRRIKEVPGLELTSFGDLSSEYWLGKLSAIRPPAERAPAPASKAPDPRGNGEGPHTANGEVKELLQAARERWERFAGMNEAELRSAAGLGGIKVYDLLRSALVLAVARANGVQSEAAKLFDVHFTTVCASTRRIGERLGCGNLATDIRKLCEAEPGISGTVPIPTSYEIRTASDGNYTRLLARFAPYRAERAGAGASPNSARTPAPAAEAAAPEPPAAAAAPAAITPPAASAPAPKAPAAMDKNCLFVRTHLLAADQVLLKLGELVAKVGKAGPLKDTDFVKLSAAKDAMFWKLGEIERFAKEKVAARVADDGGYIKDHWQAAHREMTEPLSGAILDRIVWDAQRPAFKLPPVISFRDSIDSFLLSTAMNHTGHDPERAGALLGLTAADVERRIEFMQELTAKRGRR